MAGDWIKMRTNLDTHPRVIAISLALGGIDPLHVVGMLWKVWAWADTHSLDGNALCVTDVTLDRFVDRTGFADALRKVGWLEGRDGALSFPRFEQHNGQTAKKRAETNERVAKHRNTKSVTSVTPKALPEKRREEKSIKREREGANDELKTENYPGVTLLNSEEFRTAWGRWEQKHIHLKNRTMDFTQRGALLRKLQANTADVDDAIACIEYSLAHCDNLHIDGRHNRMPQLMTDGIGDGRHHTGGSHANGARPARKTKGQLAMDAIEAMGGGVS